MENKTSYQIMMISEDWPIKIPVVLWHNLAQGWGEMSPLGKANHS